MRETPPVLNGSEQQQLREIRAYLVRLNNYIDELDFNLTQQIENYAAKSGKSSDVVSMSFFQSKYNQLKAMIENIHPSPTPTPVSCPFPIGSIIQTTSAENPGTQIGGTWEQIKDVFLLAAGDTYEAGTTGGEAEHALTVDEMPEHGKHLLTSGTVGKGTAAGKYLGSISSYGTAGRGWDTVNGNEYYPNGTNNGGSQSHNNMPPYLTVYTWKRTA